MAPPSPQKLQLAYHLTLEREELRTSLLVHPMAVIELLGMGPGPGVREARTDVGSVGVVRRPSLRKIDRFSQGLSHLRLDPVEGGRRGVRGQSARRNPIDGPRGSALPGYPDRVRGAVDSDGGGGCAC